MKATSKLTLTEYIVHHRGIRMAWTQTKPVLNRDVAKKIQQRLQDLGHLTMLVEQSVPEEWMVPQTHNHD